MDQKVAARDHGMGVVHDERPMLGGVPQGEFGPGDTVEIDVSEQSLILRTRTPVLTASPALARSVNIIATARKARINLLGRGTSSGSGRSCVEHAPCSLQHRGPVG